MVQSTLVCQDNRAAGRLSFKVAKKEGPNLSATQQVSTQEPRICEPTRLETIQLSLQERGFSEVVARHISTAQKQSTRKVYDCKWKIFADWCDQRQIDPLRISVPELADFFLFLFEEKKLNPRTIYGYRSAITTTLKNLGRDDITISSDISSLMRNFGIERPPLRKILPAWNLSLVLRVLLKPPFEPLATISLKFLTLKTVFLIALASGRRRSELHALRFDNDHFRQNQDQTMVKLYPSPDFVAKNQAVNTIARPIKIPALTSVGNDDPDKLLCPVRSVLTYRKVTSDSKIRKGRLRLFVSYKPSKQTEIARATISSWITKTIRYAYLNEGVKPETLENMRISAHEVRALSASWSAMNSTAVDTIMEACTWRGHNTFTDFYLRDMCSFRDDMFSLGDIVTGQTVVSGTT